jgi:AAA ATPase domain
MNRPSTLDRGKTLPSLVQSAPPFVGRREELAWLERILQETLAGQPRVVLMPGDAGIGKTRLLHEVRAGALRRRLQVGYGRGYEDLLLPYLPFVEVLTTLLARLLPFLRWGKPAFHGAIMLDDL